MCESVGVYIICDSKHWPSSSSTHCGVNDSLHTKTVGFFTCRIQRENTSKEEIAAIE